MKLHPWLYILILCVFTTVNHASVVKDLYRAEVSLPESGERNGALFSEALTQVLIKLTGDAHITDNPQIKLGLPNAKRWVQSFAYTPTTLQTTFQAKPLHTWLSDLNIPSWRADRPKIILWTVVQESGREHLLTAESPLLASLSAIAESLGLPIVLPETAGDVTVFDVQLGHLPKLRQASQMYNPVIYALLYLTEKPDEQWDAAWTIYTPSKSWQFNSSHLRLDQTFTAAMQDVAARLAKLYARVGQNQQHQLTELVIENIQSAEQFSKIRQYVAKLSGVEQIQLKTVTPTSVTYQLALSSSREALIDVLALNNQLKPTVSLDQQSVLVYRSQS